MTAAPEAQAPAWGHCPTQPPLPCPLLHFLHFPLPFTISVSARACTKCIYCYNAHNCTHGSATKTHSMLTQILLVLAGAVLSRPLLPYHVVKNAAGLGRVQMESCWWWYND